jgi:biofilm PGA synthesis N-glycosyltransferase PgaC
MLNRIFWFSLALIAYTYAGYSLLLTVLAGLVGRKRPTSNHTPTVTLLITAYNEAEVIAAKLKNSLALDYPPGKLDILVAADGSQDETVAVVQRFLGPRVSLSYQPVRQGKMAAINRVVAQARGEIVVFSDANNFYASDAIRQLVRPFADPQVAAASGAKRIVRGDSALGDTEGLYWRYEAYIKQQETKLGSTTGVNGEIFAIRRDLFRPLPPGTINDDFTMALDCLRRGYDVVYVGAARSYERVSTGMQDERTRRSRIVAGRFQAMFNRQLWPHNPLVIWQLLSHKYLRPFVPLAMITAFLSNLAALRPGYAGHGWLRGPAAQALFLGQSLFYAAAWFGGRLKGKGKAGKILFVPAYLVSSNVAGLVGLFRFLRGGQPAAWQRVARRSIESSYMEIGQ